MQITEAAPTAIVEARAKLIALDQRAEEAIDESVPANTRRAYEFELACFLSWCGRHSARPMPAEPRVLRAYLLELCESGRDPADLPTGKPRGPLGYSALMRTLAAICHSHQRSGHLSPWKHPVIEDTRDMLGRRLGTAPKRQKRGLEAVGGTTLLFRVCDQISDDVRGVRDRAMILVGWAGGGRRRSEIAAARVENFTDTAEGIRWTIPRSKTDQHGKGLIVLLKLEGDERYCPVRSLRRWLSVSKIEEGPVFRGVDMTTGAIMDAALAPEGVSRRIQHYVKMLGLDPAEFGGHSLRSGFVTTAVRLGKSTPDIMASTGHRTERQVHEYVRREGLHDAAAPGMIGEALARAPRPQAPPSAQPPQPPPTPPTPAAPAAPTTLADDLLSQFTKPFAPGGRR
jgi:integrase